MNFIMRQISLNSVIVRWATQVFRLPSTSWNILFGFANVFTGSLTGSITYHFGHPTSSDQLFVVGSQDFPIRSLSASFWLFLLNFQSTENGLDYFFLSSWDFSRIYGSVFTIQFIEDYKFQIRFLNLKTGKVYHFLLQENRFHWNLVSCWITKIQ